MSEASVLPQSGPGLGPVFQEVLRGLTGAPKSLPCKLFYDARGAALFERICRTEAYYPTRTETGILRTHAAEMAAELGRGCRVVELGSGSGMKTRILLANLEEPAEYVPIDISGEQLHRFAAQLRREFPDLPVRPLRADYTTCLPSDGSHHTVVFFPGSTIGNFVPGEAIRFLGRIAGLVGPSGHLLLGVDLRKDPARLERAYNDEGGITAAFNRNVLRHVNRLCAADFRPDRFRHHAFYEERLGRIEMHLLSERAATVTLGRGTEHEVALPFRAGEPIVTEYSYKYDLDGFRELAGAGGFEVVRVWTDPERLFSIQLLRARPISSIDKYLALN